MLIILRIVFTYSPFTHIRPVHLYHSLWVCVHALFPCPSLHFVCLFIVVCRAVVLVSFIFASVISLIECLLLILFSVGVYIVFFYFLPFSFHRPVRCVFPDGHLLPSRHLGAIQRSGGRQIKPCTERSVLLMPVVVAIDVAVYIYI